MYVVCVPYFMCGVAGIVLGCGMVCDDVRKMKGKREGSEWSECWWLGVYT